MDQNKLGGILVMLMAVLGALVLLFILGGGLVRALLFGAEYVVLWVFYWQR
jgi:hypothetical protein